MKKLLLLTVTTLLSGCVSQWDLQGQDPKDYYEKHPKVNKVETKSITQTVRFAPGAERLSVSERDGLRASLRDISPEASESILVQLPKAQLHNEARRTSMRKFLRSLGFVTGPLMYEPSETLARDEARITINYAAVILPDCPDWKLSPVTTYSNTSQGNIGCASVVNLGLMVADPRDLVHGTGGGHMDSERNNKVVSDYRGGTTPAAADSTAANATTPSAAPANPGQ